MTSFDKKVSAICWVAVSLLAPLLSRRADTESRHFVVLFFIFGGITGGGYVLWCGSVLRFGPTVYLQAQRLKESPGDPLKTRESNLSWSLGVLCKIVAQRVALYLLVPSHHLFALCGELVLRESKVPLLIVSVRRLATPVR